jgi:hypothetical protein
MFQSVYYLKIYNYICIQNINLKRRIMKLKMILKRDDLKLGVKGKSIDDIDLSDFSNNIPGNLFYMADEIVFKDGDTRLWLKHRTNAYKLKKE